MNTIRNMHVMEEQKFRIGEIVYDASRPGQRLVIIKANAKLYHCKLEAYMNRPAIAYAERDLRKATVSSLYLETPVIGEKR